ncbi:hypothetical protein ACRPLQ_25450 [Priestia sp. TRN 1309]|uniref:hypothetical protein n=1 Tax=Priestia sp. TRN 1309 TaxID=3420729 RepID=UPI003D788900
MTEQIKELKEKLSNLINWARILDKTCDSEEDYKELEKTDKEIDNIRAKLFQLTGDYKYATVEEVIKKYRRSYSDVREYGAISLSELYKRKRAKIEIVKRIQKRNGGRRLSVYMSNLHIFYVEKEEIEAYILKNKMKPLNRRKRQFDMLINEMRDYAHYFEVRNRVEEVHDLVRQVFGPNKMALDAKVNEIRKVIKLTKMLRNQL